MNKFSEKTKRDYSQHQHILTSLSDWDGRYITPVRATDVMLSAEHRWSCNRGTGCCETAMFIWCCWETGSSQRYFHYDNVNLLQNFQRRAMRLCVVQRGNRFLPCFCPGRSVTWLGRVAVHEDHLPWSQHATFSAARKGVSSNFWFSLTYIF